MRFYRAYNSVVVLLLVVVGVWIRRVCYEITILHGMVLGGAFRYWCDYRGYIGGDGHMSLTKEEIAERNKARCKARYDWLKANGYCVRCGREKAEKGRVTCMTCNANVRDRNRIYMREYRRTHLDECRARESAYREKLKSEGRCVHCGAPSDGKRLCRRCLNKQLAWARKRRNALGIQLRKELGICLRCDKPAVEGYYHCEHHLALLRKNLAEIARQKRKTGWHKYKLYLGK